MAKRKKVSDDFDPEQAVEAAQSLRRAAAMLTGQGGDLGEFQAYFDEGMLPHAWESLRAAAENHGVPFSFWAEMSRAAELLGGAP